MEGVTLVEFGLGVTSRALAYNGGLAERPAGSQGHSPWSGDQRAKPFEAEAGAFLGPGRPKDVANLLSFVLNHRMVPTVELTTTIIST